MNTLSCNQKYHSWSRIWLFLTMFVFLFSSFGCDSKKTPISSSTEPELKASITESVISLFGENPLPSDPQGIAGLPSDNPIRIGYEQANKTFAKMEYTKAVLELSKTLEAYKSSHPEDKRGIALLYERLGAFSLRLNYLSGDNMGKATNALKESLSIFNEVKNSEIDIALCNYYLGRDSAKKLSSEEALSYYNIATEILDRINAGNSIIAALAYKGMATVYVDSQPLDASIYYSQTLRIVKELMGKDHPDVAKIYLNLGFAELRQGNNTKALKYYQDALQSFDKYFGKSSEESAEAHFLIGDLNYKIASSVDKKEYMDMAVDNYLIAYKIFSKMPQHSYRASLIKESLEMILKLKDPNINFSDWLNAEMAKPVTY